MKETREKNQTGLPRIGLRQRTALGVWVLEPKTSPHQLNVFLDLLTRRTVVVLIKHVKTVGMVPQRAYHRRLGVQGGSSHGGGGSPGHAPRTTSNERRHTRLVIAHREHKLVLWINGSESSKDSETILL